VIMRLPSRMEGSWRSRSAVADWPEMKLASRAQVMAELRRILIALLAHRPGVHGVFAHVDQEHVFHALRRGESILCLRSLTVGWIQSVYPAALRLDEF